MLLPTGCAQLGLELGQFGLQGSDSLFQVDGRHGHSPSPLPAFPHSLDTDTAGQQHDQGHGSPADDAPSLPRLLRDWRRGLNPGFAGPRLTCGQGDRICRRYSFGGKASRRSISRWQLPNSSLSTVRPILGQCAACFGCILGAALEVPPPMPLQCERSLIWGLRR
jgi:hypothetical protein